MKGEITFVPVGGLGNRMRSVAAAVALARATGQPLHILWFRDWGLGCRFDELFMPLGLEGVRLTEASWLDTLLYDRPRRHNLYLPRLFQRLLFSRRMEERESSAGMYAGRDFAAWSRGHRVWLASYHYFVARQIPAGAFGMFRPQPWLQERIDAVCDRLGEGAVGVHIRRTDHAQAISESPTEAFVARMRELPEDTMFYLATDANAEKETLRQAFPNRILTPEAEAERGTLRGMEDAVVEMFVLSRCMRILGSSDSSYSATAANIGGIPLELIIKQ